MCSCRPGSHRSSFKYPPGTFYKGDEDLTDPEERKKLGFVQPEANAGDCKRAWAHLPYALDGKKRLRPACTVSKPAPVFLFFFELFPSLKVLGIFWGWWQASSCRFG